jgi:Flp pilus assembly pilin Flp
MARPSSSQLTQEGTFAMSNKLALIKSPRLRALLADTRGAGLVEYIILVGLIALAALAGFQYFGSSVNNKAKSLGDRVSTEIP